MSDDPIVDEVRAIRDAIADENHYDLDAIFEMLRKALREARVRGFIPRLRPLLDRLRGAGYYLSHELTRQVLETVGERRT